MKWEEIIEKYRSVRAEESESSSAFAFEFKMKENTFLCLLRGTSETSLEVTGEGYKRIDLSNKTMRSSNSGVTNCQRIEFPEAVEDWGLIRGFGVYVDEKMFFFGPLTSPVVIKGKGRGKKGDVFQFEPGSIFWEIP